jgi:hypothetical protein
MWCDGGAVVLVKDSLKRRRRRERSRKNGAGLFQEEKYFADNGDRESRGHCYRESPRSRTS